MCARGSEFALLAQVFLLDGHGQRKRLSRGLSFKNGAKGRRPIPQRQQLCSHRSASTGVATSCANDISRGGATKCADVQGQPQALMEALAHAHLWHLRDQERR